ncbi:MAG: flagellar M-ring protein FliF C-terminal domain-containing protein, partial [Limisphaerales bacterium]
DDNNDSTTSSPSTPVGITSNVPSDTNNITAAASPLNNQKIHKTQTTVQYEVSKTRSDLMQTAGGIKRISAAVTVAAKTEGAGTERKVVNRTPEELEKLRRIVASALGIQTGTDSSRSDVITLEELPFNDQFATNLTQQMDQDQKREFWWNLAKNLTYPALGLVALLVLLRLFKRTPVQELPIGVPVGRLMAGQNGAKSNGNGHGTPATWSAEPVGGVVTVDVLNRLIKENPANMNQAIREWMDKGRASHS